MKKALTIAGFDPSGGAGLQADLKVFHSCHVYGLSVVSCLTAQNTSGVSSIMPVDAGFVGKQLNVILSDLRPDATKVGMLYTAAHVRAVVRCILKFGLKNIVLDPVILSSTGKSLAQKGAVRAMRKDLLPLCTVITPNLHEAGVLAGIAVRTVSDMKIAAKVLKGLGPEFVVITGGHLGKEAEDVLYDGDFLSFRGKRVSGEFHGTGCMFSAAVAAGLAKGRSVTSAVSGAKKFMDRILPDAFSGKGRLMLLGWGAR